MAARKITTKKTEVKKSSPRKATRKSTDKVDVTDTPSTNLYSGKISSIIPTSRLKNMRINRKLAWTALTILIVLSLGYLVYRYLVVAWVDNRPVTRIQLYSQLEKQYGKDMKDQLILQELMRSDADAKGISVSKEELAAEIQKIETEQGGADQLNQVLEMEGLSRRDLNELIELRLLQQKLFTQGVNISDEDINNYMTENAETLPVIPSEDASGTAQLRDQIKEQLLQEKASENYQKWAQEQIQSNRVVRL